MTSKNFLAISFVALSLITVDAFGEMLMPVPGQSPMAPPPNANAFAARQPIGMRAVSRTSVNVRVSQQVNPVRPMPLPGQPVPGNPPGPVGGPGMGPGPGTHGAAPCPPPPCGGGRAMAVGGCARPRPCGVRVRGCMRLARGCGPRPCGGGVRVSVRVGGCFGRGRRC